MKMITIIVKLRFAWKFWAAIMRNDIRVGSSVRVTAIDKVNRRVYFKPTCGNEALVRDECSFAYFRFCYRETV